MIEFGEIAVMGPEPAGQFPYPFNAVEFWTVGRQEIEPNGTAMLFQPWLDRPCVVITSIVQNNGHLAVFPLVAEEHAKKLEKTLRAEFLCPAGNQPPVTCADCPEYRQAFSRRCQKNHRVKILGGNPHCAS